MRESKKLTENARRSYLNSPSVRPLNGAGGDTIDSDIHPDAVGSATLGWWTGVVSGIAGAGVSGVLLAMSAEDAAIAEGELRRQRNAAHELDLVVKKISTELEGWKDKAQSLVHGSPRCANL